MVKPELIEGFNAILDAYGSVERYESTDTIYEAGGLVIDANSEACALSRLLTSLVCERIPGGSFYHYTSGEAAKNICESKVLRLTSVMKRLHEGEIVELLQGFDYKHPLEIDPNTGAPNFYKSIAPGLFYASFTETDLSKDEEQYFWDTFAGRDGARLKFRLDLNSGLLRRVSYGDNLKRAIQLFREINALVANFGYKGFFWDDVGYVCALHLPGKFQIEKEIRLIAKKSSQLASSIENGFEYLELPFGSNPHLALEIELIDVQTDRADFGGLGIPIIVRS
jgi:hypothetical protein